ncbi:hypothetical protein J3R30DRAFT_3865113 [Lentinula aciculospora]|uniref:Uncharacterized protein n=1 Tax=Lentinula aciculospora TaxID=153920 RepID=A0A9W9DQ57_9AGAR|nr:hypothetical protein J3R30DRAFT_3865113 [Lentinula aciculospora]
MAPPITRQAQRNQMRTLTRTTNNSDVPNQAEESNPFLANAQSFAPYSETISALGGRRRANVFGPTTSTAHSTMEVNLEFAIGRNTETLDYEIQTLYTATGIPVQATRALGSDGTSAKLSATLPTHYPGVPAKTPRTVTRIATTSSAIIPTSPTAAAIFRQLLAQNAPDNTQIPEGQEEDHPKEDNWEDQDGEEDLVGAEENLADLEGSDDNEGPGGGGLGGPGGPVWRRGQRRQSKSTSTSTSQNTTSEALDSDNTSALRRKG